MVLIKVTDKGGADVHEVIRSGVVAGVPDLVLERQKMATQLGGTWMVQQLS